MVSNLEQNKVCVLNVDEEGRFGGPERRIANVANELKKLNIQTIVVIPNLESCFFVSYLNSLEVDFIKLNLTRLSLEKKILIRFIYRFPFEILILFKAFKSSKCELIHVNGASQFKVAIAAKLANKKVVWHLNNTFLKLPVKILFNILSKSLADGVIYAGARAGEYYSVEKKFKHLPTTNIEAPVSEKFFKIPPLKKIKTKLTIAVIGGVNPAKGIENVIDLADKLDKSNIEFKILIAGKILDSQSKYKAMLDEKIKSLGLTGKIKFLGQVDDIPELISKSHINLTLSQREASPTAVWEGLASGRIVITSNVGSVENHIQNGMNGFIVPIGATNEVVSIVNAILNKQFDIEKITKTAQDTARDNFHLSVISKQHQKIYSLVLNKES